MAILAFYPQHQLLSNGESMRSVPVVRGSDDFWPQDAGSHGPHLFANAMNSLLIANIALQDW